MQKQSQYKKLNQIQEGSNGLTELSEQESQSVVGGNGYYYIYNAQPPFPGGLGGRIKVIIKPNLE